MGVEAKRIGTRQQMELAIDAVVAQAGGDVALAATNLTTGETIERDADRSMPTASVFKLPLLAEVFRQANAGGLDLDERMTLRGEDVVLGSGILRDFAPGLQTSLRDLATMMIIVSDNTAANLLLDRVGGPERVNATMRELGLPSIVVHRQIVFGEITTNSSLAEAAPRDLMQLVAMLAREELVSPAASREMLAILGRQRYLEQAPRFVAFRPYAGDFAMTQSIKVFNKTGMINGLRADTGLIMIDPTVQIAYSMVNDTGTDDSYRQEHPSDIVNALIGRVLVEYWWPGEWNPEIAVYPSPYVDALLAQAGL
ncbi:MAG: class A beta-lactamase-related serine hydrolase [Chloroflexi bacterium]|nr:class A beta-lactamase-related serine hydrolase [Chloroflexota bacterium]